MHAEQSTYSLHLRVDNYTAAEGVNNDLVSLHSNSNVNNLRGVMQ